MSQGPGPGAETTSFPCQLNAGAAGLALVARVIYLSLDESEAGRELAGLAAPVENDTSR